MQVSNTQYKSAAVKLISVSTRFTKISSYTNIHWRLFVDFVYQKLLILSNICQNYFCNYSVVGCLLKLTGKLQLAT